MTARQRVRQVLERAGGVPLRGPVHEARPRAILRPFAASRVVAAGAGVGPPERAPEGVGFLAGVQRYVVDGHLGLAPVMRAWVAAGVLERRRGMLRCVAREAEELLVVPAGRVAARHRAQLADAGVPIVDSDAGPRPHPLLDRWAAVRAIDLRRAACERAAARRFLSDPGSAPLVVDGPLAGVAGLAGVERVIATVREHETLYLDGDDLAAMLTLPAGHRSAVFVVGGGEDGVEVQSWYLRLWPWSDDDLLHGLVRVERVAGAAGGTDADRVSRWLLDERTPIAGGDRHWDRAFYPQHEVEAYLRAHAGGWR